jgi:two-component system OmpR family sensor kinase
MSLSTRLSAFFLVTLAVVLLGFSGLLYFLARAYLYHQVDERLEAALATLMAAAEVNDEGVEWETHERRLALGQGRELDQVRWIVHDDQGAIRDRSPNLENKPFESLDEPASPPRAGSFFVSKDDQTWGVLRARLNKRARRPATPVGQEDEKHDASGMTPRFHFLDFTAAFSLVPVETSLRQLALTSGALSVGLWLLAAIVGRWLSRQALVPVTQMARAASAIEASGLARRLPNPGTHDELQDLATAFNDLLGRLEDAFARQARFTGDASHQLRTPLTAILGEVEVALRRERTTEELRAVLTRVKGRAAHLGQIVEMLLFLARADVEAMTPDLEDLDLRNWLPGYLESWQDHPRRQDLHLVEVGGPCMVRSHVPLLGQLLDNLIDNAFKYSTAATPVVVAVTKQHDSVIVSVEDQGCGIAAKDLPHVFEPFYRTEEARLGGHPGIGLGLALAQRIAVTFGGTLSVESQEGKGSRFTLRLPHFATNDGSTEVRPLPIAASKTTSSPS